MSRYAPHRPSPSAAGARLWIIRGCDRPRYIRVIFSNCRHRECTRLDTSGVTNTCDWSISQIRCDRLMQAWLTAGRDLRVRHLLTWNCQRIRAVLMYRYIQVRVLRFYRVFKCINFFIHFLQYFHQFTYYNKYWLFSSLNSFLLFQMIYYILNMIVWFSFTIYKLFDC